MDIITQGLLGATVAQGGSRYSETRMATGIGFLAGILADADVFIYSAKDTLYTIEYHRHFTHSLIFIPIGALIATLLLWPLLKKRIAFGSLYLYCLLGYLLSGVLDALTSFGTYLYWPFSNERVAWNLVSIIDPVVTLILLLSIVLGLKLKKTVFARAGLLLCCIYLLTSAWQLNRAQDYLYKLADKRGHSIERFVVKPSLGNILLWRSSYIYQDSIYIDAIRVGLSEIKHYPGSSIAQLSQHEIKSKFAEDSVLYSDIERFRYFSDDYLVWYPEKEGVIGDVRYALLPDSIMPLWGIEIDADHSEQHVRFVTFRNNNQSNRKRFYDMLKGRDVDPFP